MKKSMRHYTIPLKIIKLESGSYHLTIGAKLGEIPVNLVVDTGASHTCFDLHFIQGLNHTIEDDLSATNEFNVGLGEVGFQNKITYLSDLQIGGLIVKDYMVALLDLEHVNRSYRHFKKPPVQGLLGCDFLLRYLAQIDYMKEEMTLWCKN